MNDAAVIAALTAMDPTAFENLTFDLARASGIINLTWRTPGADGGRDIEGSFVFRDPSGYDRTEKWYIECKRYKASIDWPTMRGKLAYAENHSAEVFLLSTNSNPSPACENEIERWNSKNRTPVIRTWRGYDFPRLLRLNSDISFSHGIGGATSPFGMASTEIALILSKLVQAAHSSIIFEAPRSTAIEAAASISELLSQRLADLERHGRFTTGTKLVKATDWPWLNISGNPQFIEEVGFRSVVSFLRHVASGEDVAAEISGRKIDLKITSASKSERWLQAPGLEAVARWSLCDELVASDANQVSLSLR